MDEADTLHTCFYDITLYIGCVFYSGRIRTLGAIAIYIFHRLVMGKVEIVHILCLNGDIWKIFCRNVDGVVLHLSDGFCSNCCI